jgi:hypothetical protein
VDAIVIRLVVIACPHIDLDIPIANKRRGLGQNFYLEAYVGFQNLVGVRKTRNFRRVVPINPE